MYKRQVHVQVGEVEHPMLPEHHIAFVCLVTEKGYQTAQLAVDGAPVADFRVAEGDAPVKVYEYCNLHGLWLSLIHICMKGLLSWLKKSSSCKETTR